MCGCTGRQPSLQSTPEFLLLKVLFGRDDLYTLYQALTADPSKVLELLTEPEDELNSSEQRVYLYLKQFIGNMRSDELLNFFEICYRLLSLPKQCHLQHTLWLSVMPHQSHL